jgi:hypothetical protein
MRVHFLAIFGLALIAMPARVAWHWPRVLNDKGVWGGSALRQRRA